MEEERPAKGQMGRFWRRNAPRLGEGVPVTQDTFAEWKRAGREGGTV